MHILLTKSYVMLIYVNCKERLGMKKILFLILLFPVYLFPLTNHPNPLVIQNIQNTSVTYPIRFVLLGDSRNSDSIPPGEAGDGDSVLSTLRNTINGLNPSPDFVIHSGDFCLRGHRYEYYRYAAMIDSCNVPWLTVRGNHELYADEGPFVYDSIFGDSDFTFDYGKARFIFMSDCQQYHTSSYNSIDYLFSSSQINWLDSLLSDAHNNGMYSFVFAHVPPYIPNHDTTYCLGDTNYWPKPNYSESHTELFTNALSNYGVLIAGFGHQHFYDRYTYNGVHYIISGGAGGPPVTPLQQAPYGANFHHFVLLELYQDGTLKGYVYREGYSTPDTVYNFTYLSGIKSNNENMGQSHVNAKITGHMLFISSEWGIRKVEIIGIAGRMIEKKNINSKNSISIKLKKGVYFYKVTTTRSTDMGKVIVLD